MTPRRQWLYDLALIAVLLGAAYFRFVGLNWDENQHLHPDERFLTMVETALLPVASPSQYFDTAASPLNPHNRGYGFFVYGTLPIFIVRYLAEWLGQVGYGEVHLVGRQVSAFADLGVILLLYLIAARLYGRGVALLAAAFSSVAVMQIQQSHFFTVDNPANFFAFVAIFFAVLIATRRLPAAQLPSAAPASFVQLSRDPLLYLSLCFGFTLGMAVASKLNAAPMAILLPAAFAIRHYATARRAPEPGAERPLPDFVEAMPARDEYLTRIAAFLVAGGLAALIAFRIFQPYAFSGIGFNPQWLGNLRELQALSGGDVDVPFSLQWARRTHLYSFQNLTVWGLGLPLGVLAWLGFLWMGWRTFKGEWRHALLWGWTALYFLWQSLSFNPTMRYQLPIYPLLCLMAAWALAQSWRLARTVAAAGHTRWPIRRLAPALPVVLGLLVLLATAAWAFAFTRIYTRPHPRVAAAQWIYAHLPGPINLRLHTPEGTRQQPLPFPYGGTLKPGVAYTTPFTPIASGRLTGIYLPRVTGFSTAIQSMRVAVLFGPAGFPEQELTLGLLSARFPRAEDPPGSGYSVILEPGIDVLAGQTYFLRFETSASLSLAGAAPINESTYDDGLPLPIDGYDGFGGLYDGNLNLELYWDDNQVKLDRLISMLTQGDHIFITSNRQWASIARVPERYPLTTEYYRLLLGCPPQADVVWCYNVARPGQFEEQLGYDLVAVFESFPTLEIPGLLKWEFNDQFADEAFTVYDHPKVLIFEKRADFDAAALQASLGKVDLSRAVFLTPRQAGSYRDLMLPIAALVKQQAGGTWSALFDYDWLQNKYPLLGALLWYVFLFVLGLLAYPITRLALAGLRDRGYAVSRIFGMVLLAWMPWLGASLGIPSTRLSIALAFGILAAVAGVLSWRQRDELRLEWRSNRRLILIAELLFLAFFVLDLLIRIGNPELWHPAKGGERPMDFSYFNAVLKSVSFPPYDPWFAGGYINYYYYGFVLVGTPVKLLGIVPSIAYNLILPTLFAMLAVGAFTVGWNLLDDERRPGRDTDAPGRALSAPLLAGLSASIMMVLLGNLGTIRMIYQGFQRLAAPGGLIAHANVVQRIVWAVQGFVQSFKGGLLPFGRGDWYWFPSRVIPAANDVEPITEFPLFTFIYSDLHAHMIVLPLALLVLTWAVSMVRRGSEFRRAQWWTTFLFAGLTLGAIYPTNLSDMYTYLLIAIAAFGYRTWRSSDVQGIRLLRHFSPGVRKLMVIVLGAIALTVLSRVLYQPYHAWYSQAYGAIEPWRGSHTPISSYFTHWGLFLFVLVAWLIWETRQWMAATPVSALGRLAPYHLWFELALAVFIALLLFFTVFGVAVGWLALPLALWISLLLVRPGMTDGRRMALFLAGTAFSITLVVELVVARGDIGRMNTVFKFYLQAWTLFSVAAAAALGWLFSAVPRWLPRWQALFQAGLTLLLAGTFLFTLSATTDKIADRMAPSAPRTLDSMTYMAYAQHWDVRTMDLAEDYRAIRWMQDHVQGSPVIIEANCTEYRWCSRFTIYTGLPGVVGWNWHQRQQRALIPPNLITDRVDSIGAFYATMDVDLAREMIDRYNVRYIIVGQLERNLYPAVGRIDGLAKFDEHDGEFWRSVYRDGSTTIYEVLPQAAS